LAFIISRHAISCRPYFENRMELSPIFGDGLMNQAAANLA
jgi:hypothetical protein